MRHNKVGDVVMEAWQKKKKPGEKESKYPTYKEIKIKLYTIKDIVVQKTIERSKDYCENSTVGCLSYLVDDTLHNWETWIWVLVHLVAFTLGGLVVWVAAANSADAPAATSRNPVGQPVTDVPHPALALCSLNLISRRRVYSLVADMIKNGTKGYTEDQLANIISYSGLAYEYKEANSEKLEQLHKLLLPYNIDVLMRYLAVKCEEMILRCQWRGVLVDCATIFTFKKSSVGFCCIFNYLRKKDHFTRNNTADDAPTNKLMAMAGQERGLSVLMAQLLEDYFFTKFPNVGVKVLVFNAEDYPDMHSGSCLEQVVSPRSELYMALDATILSASRNVELLPPEERGCMVKQDVTEFRYDTYSDCMISCKLRSIKAYCGCVPFFLPTLWKGSDSCDFLDNQCLSNWKKHWDDAWFGTEDEDDQQEAQKSKLPCSYCVPTCSDVIYKAQQNALALQPNSLNSVPDSEKTPLKRNIVFMNHSVLHIYFANDLVVLLNHDLLYTWYDWMSSLGGLYGLVIGCSMLSFLELGYFILGGPPRPRATAHLPSRQLYWQELRGH